MTAVNSTSDANGSLKIYIEEGTYRLKGELTSFSSATKDIAVGTDLSSKTELALTLKTIEKQGSIAGFVYDENGVAIQGALVRISGGVYTNGYFSSATTNKDGYYKLTSISKNASDDFNNTMKQYLNNLETLYLMQGEHVNLNIVDSDNGTAVNVKIEFTDGITEYMETGIV